MKPLGSSAGRSDDGVGRHPRVGDGASRSDARFPNHKGKAKPQPSKSRPCSPVESIRATGFWQPQSMRIERLCLPQFGRSGPLRRLRRTAEPRPSCRMLRGTPRSALGSTQSSDSFRRMSAISAKADQSSGRSERWSPLSPTGPALSKKPLDFRRGESVGMLCAQRLSAARGSARRCRAFGGHQMALHVAYPQHCDRLRHRPRLDRRIETSRTKPGLLSLYLQGSSLFRAFGFPVTGSIIPCSDQQGNAP